MPLLPSLRLIMILLYFYFTLQLQLPLALTASFTTVTTSSTTSYTSVMLHYSIRVVFRVLVNQTLVKTELSANQDIQTKDTVVSAIRASRLLTQKEV